MSTFSTKRTLNFDEPKILLNTYLAPFNYRAKWRYRYFKKKKVLISATWAQGFLGDKINVGS